MDGKRVEYYDEVITLIRGANGEHAVITVERGGKLVDLEMNNLYDAATGRNYLGINIEPVRKQFGLFEAIGGSFLFVGSVIRQMLDFLGGIFTAGVQQGDFVGPVGTITFIGQAVRLGFETVLRIGVLISINLGIFNVLPLPALDGGRTVFILIEWIRGKPIPAEREGMVHFVGILLLFGLMILLTFSDVAKIVGG
ncbi:Regulator of sigma-W protease RasP [bioreactor metagenome]|uniref:Regulator of sigma-W protease RasP n=1 Tax=bioreactor metagenome TaxID=1076179 RepID=A0A645FUF4_9ZZZZ